MLYVLLADGTFQTTAPIAANATAATIQAALVGDRQPVQRLGLPVHRQRARRRYGNVVELFFQGQYRTRGVAFAEGADGRAAPRAASNYYGVETLDITLGSGNDVFNVQGTSAVTNAQRSPTATTASTSPRAPPTASPTARPTCAAT